MNNESRIHFANNTSSEISEEKHFVQIPFKHITKNVQKKKKTILFSMLTDFLL